MARLWTMNSFMCALKEWCCCWLLLCCVDFVSVSTTHDAVHVIHCNHHYHKHPNRPYEARSSPPSTFRMTWLPCQQMHCTNYIRCYRKALYVHYDIRLRACDPPQLLCLLQETGCFATLSLLQQNGCLATKFPVTLLARSMIASVQSDTDTVHHGGIGIIYHLKDVSTRKAVDSP